MTKKQIIFLVLIIIWMVLIFFFSSFNGEKSEHQSDVVIVKTAEVIKNEKIDKQEQRRLIDKYMEIVRSSAHFFLYFVLGIFVYLFINSIFTSYKKTFFLSTVICFIYSISDEIHQYFTFERAAEIKDIIIDTCGSLLAIIIMLGIKKILEKKKAN